MSPPASRQATASPLHRLIQRVEKTPPLCGWKDQLPATNELDELQLIAFRQNYLRP